jgi:DNA-3-methyladenine glycosylase II
MATAKARRSPKSAALLSIAPTASGQIRRSHVPVPPIKTDEDLAHHIGLLSEAHPIFAPVRATTSEVPLRWLDAGYKGLVWVITGQQISVAAGRAIFNRLEAAAGEVAPERVAALSDADLRAAGFSANKIRTLRAIEAAALGGGLDFAALESAPASEAIAALCAIHGIGPWTAEVYLLFAAGHPDIFPAGDLALQEAAKLAFGLEARPREKEFRALAEAWTPLRSAAARLLWAYYRAVKGGSGGAPV